MRDFNLIITTQRGNETRCAKETMVLARNLGVEDVDFRRTKFPGLLVGRLEGDPLEFVRRARGIIEKDPWTFKYIQRIVPVQRVCQAEISAMKEAVKEIADKIPNESSFKVVVNKRGSSLKREDIIREIASLIERRVDLERPDVVLQIEIIEDEAGISLLSEDDVISITKLQEKSLEG
ncbi:MAG: THUMP domain-containing protein [Candidatus Methanomethyliaceae archaeon]|nr:THUMP domain-containing protein [Candidatus Methanomethyliaceae archaeon]